MTQAPGATASTGRSSTAPQIDILVPGVGMRLNGAPLGFCTVTLAQLGTLRVLVDCGVHQTRHVMLEGLRRHGLEPEDIDVLVLTHLHFDHCENAHLFRRAAKIIHRAEIDECERHPERDVFLSDRWREVIALPNVEIMTGDELALASGIEVLHAPGHRDGQLIVTTETVDGMVVMTSDAARNARELLEGRSVVSDPDMAAHSAESVARILHLADVVIPGHDRRMRIEDGRPVWSENIELQVTIY